MSKRPRWEIWRRTHSGKRLYLTVWQARRAVLRVIVQERKWKHIHLHAYECRWGRDWRAGQSYPPHYHIGHTSKQWRRKRRWWRKRIVKRLTVWPFYRARRAATRWFDTNGRRPAVTALIKIDDLGHTFRLARPLGLCWLLDRVLAEPVQNFYQEKYKRNSPEPDAAIEGAGGPANDYRPPEITDEMLEKWENDLGEEKK
jgi:hypothetical protein